MNKNILSNVIMFAVGATVGSVVTWKLLKTKYEQLVQEEIESVREAYDNMQAGETLAEEEEPENEDEEPTERDTYKRIVQGAGYNYDEEEDDDLIEPYVIIPEEFDENGYETVTLYYYEDGVVETMLGKEVLDEETIEEWIGLDSLNHFGEYEEDSVFVRNDNMETDFEILRVAERFSEGD